MTDNVAITAGTGTPIATDDVGGVHYQITKLAFGALDTATLVSNSNGLPVTVGNASLAVTGTFYPATQPVSGTVAVTGAYQATQPVSIAAMPSTPVTGTFWQATQPISGTVTVGNASLAVTGTFFQATQPVSVAGSVAVSGPLTDTQIRATALPVSLASTTITGTVAATQSGAWNITNISGTVSLPTGAATETTLAALNTKTPAVGQTTMANSRPVVIASNQSSLPVTDVNATTGPTAFTASDAVGAAPDGVGTPVNAASTAGSIVSLPVTAGMESWTMQMTGYGTGAVYTEASLDSTNGTDGNWVAVKGRRTGTAVGVESVVYTMVANGTYRGNCAGFTYLRARLIGTGTPSIKFVLSAGSGATFLNSGIPGGTSSIGTVILGAGTAAVGSLTAGSAVIGAVTQSGTWNVGSITTLPSLVAGAAVIGAVTQSGTWNVGTITTLPALATGANTIGAVNIAAAQTLSTVTTVSTVTNLSQMGGAAITMGSGVTGTGVQRVVLATDVALPAPATPTASIITSAATTNATSVKASAGTLYSITVSNAGAAAAFVKLYNTAAAPTVGTTSIALTIPIAASGVVTIPFGPQGMRFGTGIALAITNLVGETDATAVAANQVKVLTSYI